MPVTDYTPTVAQVASLVPSRTRDDNGRVTGTFTDGVTTPGATQVGLLIADAVAEAYPYLGQSIPDAAGDATLAGYDKDMLRKSAKIVVANRVASLIEQTYFPEQVAAGHSPFKMYMDAWAAGIVSIPKALVDAQDGEEPGVDTSTQYAQFFFPDVDEMVGMNTRW